MKSRPISHQLLGLVVWLLVVFAVAALGAVASIHAQAFYLQLVKPTWAPPAGVFGPVWSALYLLMGLSAWQVWRSERLRSAGLILFFVQLAVNALWSWLFFAWHQGALAMVDVLVLLALIAGTIRLFWPTSRLAAVLLIPYFLWVAFASMLTASVWLANPGLL